MVGCTIPFCNNRSEKGYIMKQFPKDPKRKKEWIKSISSKYKNWTLSSKNPYLCEVHFSPEMWEQRMDNKKKLKLNAVPEIFEFFLKKKIVEGVLDTSSTINAVEGELINTSSAINAVEGELIITSSTTNVIEDELINTSSTTNVIEDELINTSSTINAVPSTSSTECIITNIDTQKEKDENQKREEKIRKLERRLFLQRKKIKILRLTLQTFKNKTNNDKYKKALKKICNEDQIRALFTKTGRTRNWLNVTVQRALRLRFTCGMNGYEELLKQGINVSMLSTFEALGAPFLRRTCYTH
ncbi:PREDICTED: uncharacterized protein LOC105450303 [Wasmannia auropunctata]|uniref:uncharacterized protein LOC105450303 n=1 Tax=Wasmannia auropunctata TaxID=64793 RepID=UPI0005F0A965|nr:PREDICTED: uncharacterized protein LOC105450303 [Wasmannia auropunctata]